MFIPYLVRTQQFPYYRYSNFHNIFTQTFLPKKLHKILDPDPSGGPRFNFLWNSQDRLGFVYQGLKKLILRWGSTVTQSPLRLERLVDETYLRWVSMLKGLGSIRHKLLMQCQKLIKNYLNIQINTKLFKFSYLASKQFCIYLRDISWQKQP